MLEIDQSFASLAEWRGWAERNPAVFDDRAADELAGRILRKGCLEPLTGRKIKPRHLSRASGNWREELFAFGVNSRQRAVMALIAEAVRHRPAAEALVYATEATTGLAKALAGHFPRFLGSEFAPDDETRRAILPALHQDLMALNLPSDAFDVVTTNDVLEHVPDIDVGLRELVRVLKPGGCHIGTHPFRFMDEDGDLRTIVKDGAVVHLKPPEWHVDPVAPGRGALVYETPGWDILERCRAAGFRSAAMRFVASGRYGFLTQNLGVFVLCAQK